MTAHRGADRYRTNDTALPAADIIGRPHWQARAACRDTSPAMFAVATVTPDVARICAGCAVRLLCLNQAVERNESGVWAATTVDERRVMRRELDAARRAEGTPRRRGRAVPGLNARRSSPPPSKRRPGRGPQGRN